MTTTPQLKRLTAGEQQELAAFVERHGLRVRRATAKQLLAIKSDEVFRKFVDAHPEMQHQLDGERQCKYLTEVIWRHVPRCATRLEVRK